MLHILAKYLQPHYLMVYLSLGFIMWWQIRFHLNRIRRGVKYRETYELYTTTAGEYLGSRFFLRERRAIGNKLLLKIQQERPRTTVLTNKIKKLRLYLANCDEAILLDLHITFDDLTIANIPVTEDENDILLEVLERLHAIIEIDTQLKQDPEVTQWISDFKKK